jgi:ubiquinone/menaquinone biosynthesis C-methylase UbiE
VKSDAALPDYSAELDAFHRAHRPELRQIIADLKLPLHSRVLDVACGDGAYSRLLAERLESQGIVIGADLSAAYLKVAQKNSGAESEFLVAGIESLPFAARSFDVAWCAQSLVSLPKPLAVLREMLRVLRPGGLAVVLENDSLHELILPWPEELELAIRAAEWRAYRATKKSPQKRYLGRRLSSLMRRAGMISIERKTYATDRVAPFSQSERMFLDHHLQTLRITVWPYLAKKYQCKFDRLVQRDSARYLLAQPDAEMTWLDVVCSGRKASD